jgi:drug/metabolite transporter (DMT)-like permease
MTSSRRSLTELNVSLLILAMVPLFAKTVDLSAFSLIFYRSALGALALGGWLLLRREAMRLNTAWEYGTTFVVCLLMAVHWVTYFHAVQVSTVAVAVTALFTFPALTVLIEPLVYRERPRGADLALALFALCGVALVVPSFDLADASVRGVLWGVFSALLFAVRNVFYRRWLRHVGGGKFMAYQLGIVALVLLPFIEPVSAVAPTDWGYLLLLGVVFTALGHSLFIGSMGQLKAKTASLIACLQPFYSIIAGIIVLGERPSVRTAIGGAMVLSVAVVESLRTPAVGSSR